MNELLTEPNKLPAPPFTLHSPPSSFPKHNTHCAQHDFSVQLYFTRSCPVRFIHPKPSLLFVQHDRPTVRTTERRRQLQSVYRVKVVRYGRESGFGLLFQCMYCIELCCSGIVLLTAFFFDIRRECCLPCGRNCTSSAGC